MGDCRNMCDPTVQELREALARHEAILSSLPGGIAIYDADCRYRFINRYMEDLAGLPLATLLGRTPWDVFPFLLAGSLPEALAKVLAGGTVPPFDMLVQGHRPSPFWILTTLAPLRDPEGRINGVIGLVRDVTEPKAQDETQARARQEASLVLMAGSIAHDFNNLFQAVSGSLGILKLVLANRPDVLKLLATAEEALGQATRLSWKMNEFSGRVFARMERIHLPGLVRAWASEQSGPQPVLDLEEVPAILADPGQLRTVFAALLDNAREALKEAGLPDGQLRLGLRLDPAPDPALGRWAGEAPAGGPTVCLSFANEGPSPAPDVLTRMFDPFFSTKAQGRGLGLASAVGLLQANRAGIQVVPGQGKGVTFRLHFPPRDA